MLCHVFLHVFLLAVPLLAAKKKEWRQNTNLHSLFDSCLSPGVQIIFPSSPLYAQEITPRWSLWKDPTFVAAIKPVTEKDVQTIVKVATNFSIPFFATGGAHGTETGYANVTNAINIDLGNFNTTSLDAANNLLTVGGSTMFSEFYDLLYNAGKEIQTGNAPCVNMVGATLGAGVGPLQGLHGLIIDALVSVRMVTAAGDLITVSATQYPDLFWAIRGAGANFGIITSAVYEVHNHTNNGNVVNADFAFNPAVNISLFEVMQSFDDNLPPELSLNIGLSYNYTAQRPSLNANIIFFGTQEAFAPYLTKFVALNPLVYRNITVPWNQLPATAGFGHASATCTRGAYVNGYSVGLGRTDPAYFSSLYGQLAAFSSTKPWFQGSLSIQRYSNAAALAVPASQQGVYPWRNIKTLFLFENIYPNSSYDSIVDGFFQPARAGLVAVSGFPTEEVYINYAHGNEGPDVWFGAQNLPRLSALKREWDPNNYFGKGNPVPA